MLIALKELRHLCALEDWLAQCLQSKEPAVMHNSELNTLQ